MNARKRLMERRGFLLTLTQEELVDAVLNLERNQDIQVKSKELYRQRLSFYQNMHHKMNNLKPIIEKEEKIAYFHFKKNTIIK